ncbi:hypothetical protein BGY98DRAFT_1007382 [Russula aff. rugulosa BPL654]|nr:hypothetical protein BGY98DRAFT_1007382 [Russula aff. rugulosa BPL654]
MHPTSPSQSPKRTRRKICERSRREVDFESMALVKIVIRRCFTNSLTRLDDRVRSISPIKAFVRFALFVTVNIGFQFEGVFLRCLGHAVRKIVVFVNIPWITTGKLLAVEALEHPEKKKSYAGEAERECRRKRGVIRAVLASNGKDRETCV